MTRDGSDPPHDSTSPLSTHPPTHLPFAAVLFTPRRHTPTQLMTDQTDLHDALTDIHGIGEAKADEILDAVEAHAGGPDDAVREAVEDARDYHDAGDHEYAAKFVRRAAELLDDGTTE